MPPRYAYWTIIVDNAPTAFRSGSKEELMPTFNRLKEKHASAVMMWWQNGKLWPSRLDAQEAMRARGEMGRRGDERQLDRRSASGGGADRPPFRERPSSRDRSSFGDRKRSPFKPAAARAPREDRDESGKLGWKPKGEFTPAPKRDAKPFRSEKPDWKPKARSSEKPEWKPRPSRPQDARAPRGKLDWTPKSGYVDKAERPATEKRKWVPKTEYKKALGIEPRKDSKWRPGGEHKDPKQKYKDAKKAKWTQYKQTIRKRWEAKGGKKRRDEE